MMEDNSMGKEICDNPICDMLLFILHIIVMSILPYWFKLEDSDYWATAVDSISDYTIYLLFACLIYTACNYFTHSRCIPNKHKGEFILRNCIVFQLYIWLYLLLVSEGLIVPI